MSLSVGIGSFIVNASNHNIGGMIVDGFSILVDAAALVTPFVPGGAGAAVNAMRAARTTRTIVSTARSVVASVDSVKKGDTVGAVINIAASVTPALGAAGNKAFSCARDSYRYARNAKETGAIISWASTAARQNAVGNIIKAAEAAINVIKLSDDIVETLNSDEMNGESEVDLERD